MGQYSWTLSPPLSLALYLCPCLGEVGSLAGLVTSLGPHSWVLSSARVTGLPSWVSEGTIDGTPLTSVSPRTYSEQYHSLEGQAALLPSCRGGIR